MLKKAVASHNAASKNKTLAQQLFSSSPPVQQTASRSSQHVPPQPNGPLSVGSGNAVRPGAASRAYGVGLDPRSTTQHAGVKRNASGLAKALNSHDAFEDPLYPQLNSQENPLVIDDSPVKHSIAASSNDVFFDENDFDSDVDLDVEDPATRGSVKYPDLLPPPVPVSRSYINPSRPRQASLRSSVDSGYHTLPPQHDSPPPIQSSNDALPWSSSPLDHLKTPPASKTPLWHQYAYPNSLASSRAQEVENKPRPTKRRTLPWLQHAEEEAEEEISAKTNQKQKRGAGIQAAFTPLPKDSKKSTYPWNTTASAIKEQQKQLRQANKKLVKTNEGTEEEKKAAKAKSKNERVHKVFLSEEQQHVLSLVVNEKNSVFFTGSAGTGKSVLLREIITALRKKYAREPDRVAVTASTGLAACNVGGVTLHSFAGIGLGREEVPELIKKIRRSQKARHRWMRTKILIIDEISMVDGELFDKLEEIARRMRNNGRPFGGIQLVITGDFFQLPPVPDYKKESKFAFDAGTWNTSIEHTIGLHHVFRQKDPEFASMLNEMREGRLSPQSIARFRSLNRELKFEDQLSATELFPTRAEVDSANSNRMRNLQGEVRIFEARDSGSIADKTQRDKVLANCMAPATIALKKGAQVMLIKNIDETLVNGSLGKVIGFMSETTFDNYQQNEEEYYATQASSLDIGDEGGPGLSEAKIKARELVASTAQHFPVVRFAIADGSTRDLLCQRESWKVELPNGEVQASRSQVPLILAWALSIHKAQGQTLERVKVDMGRVFEKGQAYVALSRATSIAGLQVIGFDPKRVQAHDKVRKFYDGLSRAETLTGKGKGKEGGVEEDK